MRSGEVRNEMQIWADWRGHTLPGYTGPWVVRRSQDRESPATCGSRMAQVEWSGISRPWLCAIAPWEGAELGFSISPRLLFLDSSRVVEAVGTVTHARLSSLSWGHWRLRENCV